MTEREKMLAGKLYNPMDPELVALRARARSYTHQFNASSDKEEKKEIIKKLVGNVADDNYLIEGPFFADYGCNLYLGKNFFANFNFVVLDVGRVDIGDNVMIATNVQLLAATHPVDIATRYSGKELGAPVTIESNVWIGGGVIVNPGVCIGEGAVIGSGSVVIKDVPPHVVAAGNPCRVIREIDQNRAYQE